MLTIGTFCFIYYLQIVTNGSFDNITDDVFAFDIITNRVTEYVAPLWDTDFTLAVVYCVIVGMALFLGIFGNIIILIVTLSTNAMNKIGRYFVINLALADLCVAGIADPMCIIGKLLELHTQGM